MSTEYEYMFHVHKTVPLWRLVIRRDLGYPAETTEAEWRYTRSRTHDDTNVEVRDMIADDGYSLFKVGGTFQDVEADKSSMSHS